MKLRPPASRSGFTLIEMIIGAAVGSIILISAYICLRAGLTGQNMVDARTDATQGARVAMDLLAADLHAATPLCTDFDFLGRNRTVDGTSMGNMDFATHNYSPRAAREGDICEISYFVEKPEGTNSLTLWRRRDPTPDDQPLAGGGREEIIPNIIAFKLEYYDGFEWFTTWGDAEGKYEGVDTTELESNTYGMPEAVRVTLTVPGDKSPTRKKNDDDKDDVATLTFQTVVRLDLAAASYQTSSGGGSGSDEGSATN